LNYLYLSIRQLCSSSEAKDMGCYTSWSVLKRISPCREGIFDIISKFISEIFKRVCRLYGYGHFECVGF